MPNEASEARSVVRIVLLSLSEDDDDCAVDVARYVNDGKTDDFRTVISAVGSILSHGWMMSCVNNRSETAVVNMGV